MKIGVIGAGTMGQGIAKAFAQVEGNTVALCDIKQEWAENGLAKIKKGYEKLVAKGKMTQEKADAIVAAITPGLKEDLCADCDLVVEAAFEDMKVKQTTFGELDKICKPECIFASNTSSLSITEIGKGKCLIPLIFCLLQILMQGSVRMPSAHFVPALHLILYFSRLYSSWDLHRGEYRFCRLFQHLKALEQDLLRHILLLHIHLKEQVFICLLCCREHFCSVWHL